MRTSQWLLVFIMLTGAGCGGSEGDSSGADVLEVATGDDSVVMPDVPAADIGGTDVLSDTISGPDALSEVVSDVGVGPDITPEVIAGCPPVLTGKTCSEVAACAFQCHDVAYLEACRAQAASGVVVTFDALAACLDEADCLTTAVYEDEQLSACARSACAEEIGVCLIGTAGCWDIRNCRLQCDPEDEGCPLRCFAQGDDPAQTDWVAYTTCILGVSCATTDLRLNGWPTQECEQHAWSSCPTQYQACFPLN